MNIKTYWQPNRDKNKHKSNKGKEKDKSLNLKKLPTLSNCKDKDKRNSYKGLI